MKLNWKQFSGFGEKTCGQTGEDGLRYARSLPCFPQRRSKALINFQNNNKKKQQFKLASDLLSKNFVTSQDKEDIPANSVIQFTCFSREKSQRVHITAKQRGQK
jgi:hypothetical protein